MPAPRTVNAKSGTGKSAKGPKDTPSQPPPKDQVTGINGIPVESINPQNGNKDLLDVHVDPLDFESLPIEALRKYRLQNKLSTPSAESHPGWMLHCPLGKRTASQRTTNRVSKKELAAAVKKHFVAQSVRESDTIVDFIYSVKRQDDAFKLQFNN
ncbi:hypothetical protein TRVA0_008S02608 [Trichomonascus vanleenenianus]|uniref:Sap30p n=1 Tax=Trichomonascus vanleenenianus TaxID=2268995 RepID=UPI003EC9B43D